MTRAGALRLEVAAVGTDVAAARDLAAALRGRLLVDERAGDLPFRALVTAVTDDLYRLAPAADVGLYFVCRRSMLARPEPPPTGRQAEGIIGVYPMVHHPDLTHAETDMHWRNVHAPLALEHHTMTHYEQLSIVHRIRGPEWDGIALCGMPSADDLRHHFYESGESRRILHEDIASFADTTRSPRRLIAVETRFE